MENVGEMGKQRINEPCKKEACDIQTCLIQNQFMSHRCLEPIEKLQSCCEKIEYKSTHCASVSGLLKRITKIAKHTRS